MPPDLTAPTNDNRYAVPAGGETTLSRYESTRAQQGVADSGTVLPKVANMHIERAGSERWLVVSDESPAQLWPLLKDFWQENGFLIKTDQPQLGIMQTGWAEDRAKLPGSMAGLSLASGHQSAVLHRRARQVPHPARAHARTARAPRSTSAIRAWRRSTRTRTRSRSRGSRARPTRASRPSSCAA